MSKIATPINTSYNYVSFTPLHTLCVKWLFNTTSNVIVFQHHFEHGWSTIQSSNILNIFYLAINWMCIMASRCSGSYISNKYKKAKLYTFSFKYKHHHLFCALDHSMNYFIFVKSSWLTFLWRLYFKLVFVRFKAHW